MVGQDTNIELMETDLITVHGTAGEHGYAVSLAMSLPIFKPWPRHFEDVAAWFYTLNGFPIVHFVV